MAIKLIKFKEKLKQELSPNYSLVKMLDVPETGNVEISVWTWKDEMQNLQTSNNIAYFVLQWEMIVDQNTVDKVWDIIWITAGTKYTIKWIFKSIIIIIK